MNKTQHTPGDLVFAYGSIYRSDTLRDESSIRIALLDRNEPHTTPTERDANGAEMVRRWNCHEELVEALQNTLGAWARGDEPGDFGQHPAIQLARSALAKGEQHE